MCLTWVWKGYPRDLRHTAATLAVASGANVKSIQRMIGHASAAMTFDIYAELFDDSLDLAADLADELGTVGRPALRSEGRVR